MLVEILCIINMVLCTSFGNILEAHKFQRKKQKTKDCLMKKNLKNKQICCE